MEHKSRDTIVGLFTLVSLFCFGWMVFKFGDLPGFVSKMDANQISIKFSEIPGIQENSAVYFRGFSIGKVVEIDPPSLRESRDGSNNREYFAVALITIPKEYEIPDNIVPKIFQRGLGSSYIELALKDEHSEGNLKDGDVLYGEISEGSQFISEGTQNKLDNLIVSLNQLSNSLQSQLTSVPPSSVDGNNDYANLTTAIMRFDKTLSNINEIIGDSENQENIKTFLNEMAAASGESRELIAKAEKLMVQSETTVQNIDTYAKSISDSVVPVTMKAQAVADELIVSLKTANAVMNKAADGTGTVNKLLDDPALYESLTDTAERLSLAAGELQKILAFWRENGVKMKF